MINYIFNVSTHYRLKQKSQNISGFSLIEILIATFILAFGFLSIATLENTSLTRSYDDYLRSMAISRLRNICERFYVNGDITAINDWNKENNVFLPFANSKTRKEKNGYSIQLCWRGHGKDEKCLTTIAVNLTGS